MKLSLIVAMDKNGLIGNENELPWHYPEDLKYFKQKTLGSALIMGYKTFESIIHYKGKPLKNRIHFVLTRKENESTLEKYPNVEYFSNIESLYYALEIFSCMTSNDIYSEEIFIIGGRSIYLQFINNINNMYVTHINKEFEGNIYFPSINWNEWALIKQEVIGDLTFAEYIRK